MLVSGLDHVIDAFEAGWDSLTTQREICAFDEQIMSGSLAEFWQDGRYFAQREIEALKIAERTSRFA
jgi:hypothetical protein